MNEDGTMVTGLGQDGDDGMEGLESLMDDADGDVSMMDENGGEGSDGGPRRRASLPSIKTDFHPGHQVGHQPGQHTPMTPASGYVQRSHNNTYPQLSGARTASTSGPSPGNLFPPNYPHGFKTATPTSTSPSMQTNTLSSATTASPSAAPGSANPSILSPQNVLSDSPRPVSPGILQSQPEGTARERTPSFAGFINTIPQPQRERDGMFVHMSHQPPPGSQQNPQQQPSGPQGGSGPAPQANMGGTVQHNNANMFAGADGVWEYIRTLEERIKGLENKVVGLESTIASAGMGAQQRQQQQQQQKQQTAPGS